MTPDEAKQLAAELRTDLPVIDLHGLYPTEALEQLDIALCAARQQDSAVRVVYGGGTGKLAEAVLGYLQTHPVVATIRDQGGSCICLFN